MSNEGMECFQLVWSEDENEESLGDAVRRLTGLAYFPFRHAATGKRDERNEVTSYSYGDFIFMDYDRKASEIHRRIT